MIKNTVIALITATALVGVAAPAFADVGSPSIVADYAFEDNALVARLKDKGVNASSVEQWGSDMVRAYVTLDDGTKTMQFFTNDTLTPVTL